MALILFSSSGVTISTTSINPACITALCSSSSPQSIQFAPKVGEDIGKISWLSSASSFQWNVTSTDYLRLDLPTIGPTALSNSAVFYNSTSTAWEMSNAGSALNVYFEPSQYSAKIELSANLLAAQSVCLPFTAPSIITQVSSTSVQAGSEVFDWSDVSAAAYAPTWAANKLCMSLPIGQTNIDPLALDGSGKCFITAAISCTISLTTTSSPDLIVAGCGIAIAGTGADHCTKPTAAGLTFSEHYSNSLGVTNNMSEWTAVASSPLTALTVTCNITTNAAAGGCIIFGVSGVNTASPFDPTFPSTGTGTASIPTATGLTTSNANDILIGLEENQGNLVETAGACAGSTCTLIQTNANLPSFSAEYIVVSSTQVAASVAFGTTTAASKTWVMLADAFRQAPSCCTLNNPQDLTLTYTSGGSPSTSTAASVTADSGTTVTVTGLYSCTYTILNSTSVYQWAPSGLQVWASASLTGVLDYSTNIIPFDSFSASSVHTIVCDPSNSGLTIINVLSNAAGPGYFVSTSLPGVVFTGTGPDNQIDLSKPVVNAGGPPPIVGGFPIWVAILPVVGVVGYSLYVTRAKETAKRDFRYSRKPSTAQPRKRQEEW